LTLRQPKKYGRTIGNLIDATLEDRATRWTAIAFLNRSGLTMQNYIARRLLALIPTLLFASIIVFIAVRLIPGSIIDLMLSQNDISASRIDRAALETALGLDRPLYVQYFVWLSNIALRGDLGQSLWLNIPVVEQLFERIPVTLELGAMALGLALCIGIPVGVYSAIRQDTIGDYLTRSGSILMLAIPGFWLGTIVMVFPAIWWGWSPQIQFVSFWEDPLRNLQQMIIPAAILGTALSAAIMRMTRTMMLETLRQDYIRTASAKGLNERLIILRHALRNALIPVITLVGLQAPILIGGAVVMEQIFAIPGMGLLLLEAVGQRDYPIITGVFLLVGFAVTLINLTVDLSYGLLDPRVRYA
jgi:peptide/nickel transport system permease protein